MTTDEFVYYTAGGFWSPLVGTRDSTTAFTPARNATASRETIVEPPMCCTSSVPEASSVPSVTKNIAENVVILDIT